jgi:pyruvate dehydrogenase E2 component (dihydrolipoamide acetyltransferase)
MAQVLNLPRMSDTMEEGVIASFKIKVGDTIKTGDVIADVETDKATMEWEVIRGRHRVVCCREKRSTVPVEGMVAILGKPGEDYAALLAGGAAPAKAAAKVEASSGSRSSSPGGSGSKQWQQQRWWWPVKASPLAKSIAKELGVDLQHIAGSGEEGRIVKRDVEAAAVAKPGAAKSVNTTVAGQESYEEYPVSQMRKAVARRLAERRIWCSASSYLTMENQHGQCHERASGHE